MDGRRTYPVDEGVYGVARVSAYAACKKKSRLERIVSVGFVRRG